MKRFKVGHVYKVTRREHSKLKGYKDYYCTVIKNINAGKPLPNGGGFHNEAKLHSYIPNHFSRPLNDGDGCMCNLEDRMEYVGTYQEHGILLFNQDLPKELNPPNQYNTSLSYMPNLNPFLDSKIFKLS